MGTELEEARALTGLARIAEATGDSEAARRHRRDAVGIYERLGVTPEAIGDALT
jgi:hypothetical protein